MPRYHTSVDVAPPTFQTLAQSAPSKTVNYLRDGLTGVDHLPYRGPRSFTRVMAKRIDGFEFNGAAQYVVFSPVTPQAFEEINDIRNTHFKGLRFMYIGGARILIIKFRVSIVHELAHRVFVRSFEQKLFEMGLDRELVPMGGTGFWGPGSAKEADSAFKPSSRRTNNWPTLVVECGVAESLSRLQVDAQWWLETSAGDVKTVIVISVSVPERNFHFEKWELSDVADPSDSSIFPPTITEEAEIIGEKVRISSKGVTRRSFAIDFTKTMLFKPQVRCGEGNFTFSKEDLLSFADRVRSNSQ